MGNNNHNDMGGHLVPYGKRKSGGRSKLKCIHYSKADNYCRIKNCKCFGASCYYYSEKHLEKKTSPKKEKLNKKQAFNSNLKLDVNSVVTHKNFGRGTIVELNNIHVNYIVVKFEKDGIERKIPFPKSYIDGMLVLN